LRRALPIAMHDCSNHGGAHSPPQAQRVTAKNARYLRKSDGLVQMSTSAGVRTFDGPAIVNSFGEWPDVLDEIRTSFFDAVCDPETARRALTLARWSDHFRDARTEAWRTESRQYHDHPGWRALRPRMVVGSAASPTWRLSSPWREPHVLQIWMAGSC
jgi:hypothetical protein